MYVSCAEVFHRFGCTCNLRTYVRMCIEVMDYMCIHVLYLCMCGLYPILVLLQDTYGFKDPTYRVFHQCVNTVYRIDTYTSVH